jgi:hypothetical protein
MKKGGCKIFLLLTVSGVGYKSFTKKGAYPGFEIRKKFIPNPDPGGKKALDPDPQHGVIVTSASV